MSGAHHAGSGSIGASDSPALAALLSKLRAEPSRTGSLLITVFGEAIVPRGGSVWLGTLQAIADSMGIAEGVVRTALSRLTAEGWLDRARLGRNSFYRLSADGQARFAPAMARVYGKLPGQDIGLRVALMPERDERSLTDLRRMGFVSPQSGVWVASTAQAVGVLPDAAIDLGQVSDPSSARRLVAQAWPIDVIAGSYRAFATIASPFGSAAVQLDGLSSLVARILLGHEYRRVVLRDPWLPTAFLPESWPGHVARVACRLAYRALLPRSETWLDENGRGEEGPLPQPDPPLADRYPLG